MPERQMRIFLFIRSFPYRYAGNDTELVYKESTVLGYHRAYRRSPKVTT